MEEIKVNIIMHPKYGNLWHYGHFIHDFIMPIIYYINTVNINIKRIYLINNTLLGNNLYRTSLGTLKPIAEKILGIELVNIEPSQFTNLEAINLDSLMFGPYNKNNFKYMIPHVIKKLCIAESSIEIVLIQRGLQKLANNILDTGSNRRSLNNHKDIEEYLKDKYGDKFMNVILEETPIENQISLFKNAKIVIGQHGAGLCNIVWMTVKDALVIEFPPYLCDTFKNMTSALDIQYKRIDNDIYILDKILNQFSALT